MKSSLLHGLSVQTEGEMGIFSTYKGRQYTYSLIKISYSIHCIVYRFTLHTVLHLALVER